MKTKKELTAIQHLVRTQDAPVADRRAHSHDFQPARPCDAIAENLALQRALVMAIENVGKRMENAQINAWEGQNSSGDHVWSRNDLKATAEIIHYVAEALSDQKLALDVTYENEEVPLIPLKLSGSRRLRLVIDPVDGSKAFDAWKAGADVPLPRPG